MMHDTRILFENPVVIWEAMSSFSNHKVICDLIHNYKTVVGKILVYHVFTTVMEPTSSGSVWSHSVTLRVFESLTCDVILRLFKTWMYKFMDYCFVVMDQITYTLWFEKLFNGHGFSNNDRVLKYYSSIMHHEDHSRFRKVIIRLLQPT